MTTNISLITATYNSASFLQDCLDSVQSQSSSVEHIIIDGGSTDTTLEIVSYYPQITKIISEPDRGIYDAMNKGIALANCEVIGILNSDDFYADEHVLEKVSAAFADPAIDTCYADLDYVAADDTTKVTRRWKSGTYRKKSFYWGWMPPHPTFFVRSSIYEKYGMFNLSLGSAADYELMLRFLVKHKITSVYIPDVLVKMRSGGVSNSSLRNRLKANRMDRRAWEINGLKPYPWTICMKPLRKLGQFWV